MRRLLCLGLPAALLLSATVALAGAPSLEWSDVYDAGADLNDTGLVLLPDPDGNIIVGGESADANGSSDLYLRKLSRDTGAVLWTCRWEEPGGNDMAIVDLAFDPLGDILVGGYVRGCVG